MTNRFKPIARMVPLTLDYWCGMNLVNGHQAFPCRDDKKRRPSCPPNLSEVAGCFGAWCSTVLKGSPVRVHCARTTSTEQCA